MWSSFMDMAARAGTARVVSIGCPTEIAPKMGDRGGGADTGIIGDLGHGFRRYPTTLQGPSVVPWQQEPLDPPTPGAACSPDQGESALLPARAAIGYAYDSCVVVCAVRLLDQLDGAAPSHFRDLHASVALGQNSVETVAQALQAAACFDDDPDRAMADVEIDGAVDIAAPVQAALLLFGRRGCGPDLLGTGPGNVKAAEDRQIMVAEANRANDFMGCSVLKGISRICHRKRPVHHAAIA